MSLLLVKMKSFHGVARKAFWETYVWEGKRQWSWVQLWCLISDRPAMEEVQLCLHQAQK